MVQHARRLGGDAGDVGGIGQVAGSRRDVGVRCDPLDAPCSGDDARALLGEKADDAGADPGAGAGHQAGAVLEFEVHRSLMNDHDSLANHAMCFVGDREGR